MADDLSVVWKAEAPTTGVRLEAIVGNGALLVTLERKSVFFQKDSPPSTGWLVHSRLAVLWPTSIEEAVRLVSHWLDFYDPNLKSDLGALAEKLTALSAVPKTSTPPQGDLN